MRGEIVSPSFGCGRAINCELQQHRPECRRPHSRPAKPGMTQRAHPPARRHRLQRTLQTLLLAPRAHLLTPPSTNHSDEAHTVESSQQHATMAACNHGTPKCDGDVPDARPSRPQLSACDCTSVAAGCGPSLQHHPGGIEGRALSLAALSRAALSL